MPSPALKVAAEISAFRRNAARWPVACRLHDGAKEERPVANLNPFHATNLMVRQVRVRADVVVEKFEGLHDARGPLIGVLGLNLDGNLPSVKLDILHILDCRRRCQLDKPETS